jgi:hypothetical protein
MLGPCLVVLAVALIGSVAFLYFGYLLPLLLVTRGADGEPQGWGEWLRFLHGSWAAFLLFNVLFNYAACVLTPPGGLGDEEQPQQQQGQGFGVYQYEEEGVTYALAAGGGNGSSAGAAWDAQQQQQQQQQREQQQHQQQKQVVGGVDPRTFGFCKKCKVPRPPR